MGPSVRMATPTDALGHPAYKTLPLSAPQEERSDFVKETKQRLKLLQQQYNLQFAMGQEYKETISEIAVLRRMLLDVWKPEEQLTWQISEVSRLAGRLETTKTEFDAAQDIADKARTAYEKIREEHQAAITSRQELQERVESQHVTDDPYQTDGDADMAMGISTPGPRFGIAASSDTAMMEHCIVFEAFIG